jgi:ankyrin repeat protein
MTRGKFIALFIASTWIIALLAYTILRPRFALGKELLKAAEKGDSTAVSTLLDKGAVINIRDRDGHTPLWLAATTGRTESVRILLEHKADPNTRGQDGWTPLMWAVQQGHADVVKLLLEHGANVNAKGINGESMLEYCKDKPEITEMLKKAGAK